MTASPEVTRRGRLSLPTHMVKGCWAPFSSFEVPSHTVQLSPLTDSVPFFVIFILGSMVATRELAPAPQTGCCCVVEGTFIHFLPILVYIALPTRTVSTVMAP